MSGAIVSFVCAINHVETKTVEGGRIMAFVNEKPDPKTIVELPHEVKQDMLRAFALGNTIETIGKLYNLSVDDVTTFLNNRAEEIVAIKDFYTKLGPDVVNDAINEINEKAVKENEC